MVDKKNKIDDSSLVLGILSYPLLWIVSALCYFVFNLTGLVSISSNFFLDTLIFHVSLFFSLKLSHKFIVYRHKFSLPDNIMAKELSTSIFLSSIVAPLAAMRFGFWGLLSVPMIDYLCLIYFQEKYYENRI